LTIRQLANYNLDVNQFMEISRALADESRVRLVMALAGRELCVCQLIELLGLATNLPEADRGCGWRVVMLVPR
jgi:hypothetical protein